MPIYYRLFVITMLFNVPYKKNVIHYLICAKSENISNVLYYLI